MTAARLSGPAYARWLVTQAERARTVGARDHFAHRAVDQIAKCQGSIERRQADALHRRIDTAMGQAS